MTGRPPFPPFTLETARQKVQAAEDAWNTRDPERCRCAYSEDSVWRNRDRFMQGRAEIVAFLTQKWERELDYALRKALWTFAGNRIAVRFQYECHDAAGTWYRSYGNELWEFDDARPDACVGRRASTTSRSTRPSGGSSGRGRRPTAAPTSRCSSHACPSYSSCQFHHAYGGVCG